MAGNSIELIKKYAAENLDKIFVMESVTGILENRAGVELRPVENDAEYVYIPDISMDGLGDYSRDNGFPEGDVSLSWTPYKVRKDRGRQFSIDKVVDAESAGITSAKLMNEFLRTKVIPEVDAYRLSTLANEAVEDNVVPETIAANTIISKFNDVIKTYTDNEIALDNLIIFISTEVDKLIRNSTELSKQVTQADYKVGDITFKVKLYDGMPLVVVPKTRFKTSYAFGSNGFTPTVAEYKLTEDSALDEDKTYYTRSGTSPNYVYAKVTSPNVNNIATYYEVTVPAAQDINFMVVHTNAALPYKKHQAIRVFAPEVNQNKDAWLFQYRLYHDIITPKNKQKGLYVSVKA